MSGRASSERRHILWGDILQRYPKIYNSLSFRLVFWVGLILLLSTVSWAYFSYRFQKQEALDKRVNELERLGNTVLLGTHYAMMLNARDDIAQIIRNVAKQKELESIRILNKNGATKYSNIPEELDRVTDLQSETCSVCHKQTPPLEEVPLLARTRVSETPDGVRRLVLISPVYSEPTCATASCHVHAPDKKILGLLEVVMSLENVDHEIMSHEKEVAGLALALFLATAVIVSVFLMRFVNRPIKKMIASTRRISQGEYDHQITMARDDEIGQLAKAITEMRQEISEKQETIRQHWQEYQKLFEESPCYITVQDKDLRIVRFNREFAERFSPNTGDFCYKAYKSRTERCEICPVLRTFEDGMPHYSEEAALNRDGTETYWMVKTSPIKNAQGEVIAAMEMSLDLTHIKFLEKEAKKSEEKYRTIFDTIPNPVFVLEEESLKVLDCNRNVTSVYGYRKEDLLHVPFLELFPPEAREDAAAALKTSRIINRAKQIRRDGHIIDVTIHISTSEYSGQRVFLVTASDITVQLMAEQQLIQASKMATLGEMATGIAHELNQPLSVIKTAASFIRRKVAKQEPMDAGILKTMAEEMDSHVDRAERIVNHMREFGRKSEVAKERVQVNEVLKRALDFFKQQLKLREIVVTEDMEGTLPMILADPNRLEQVFINLLINARDAVEKASEQGNLKKENKSITLRTSLEQGMVTVRVTDNGIGIPESIQEKIFEPFFTTKTVGKGTGLGLSISYGIVRDYDGTIRVDSKEGEGATFTVQFPLPQEAE